MITESLLMLGPVRMTVVVVVDEVVLEVELVVEDGLVVAVGDKALVVVPASLPPQEAATMAKANRRKIVRLMSREDKSG